MKKLAIYKHYSLIYMRRVFVVDIDRRQRTHLFCTEHVKHCILNVRPDKHRDFRKNSNFRSQSKVRSSESFIHDPLVFLNA